MNCLFKLLSRMIRLCINYTKEYGTDWPSETNRYYMPGIVLGYFKNW